MSGGKFDYNQYRIGYIVDEIEQLIRYNDSDEVDDYGHKRSYGYPVEIIEEFKVGVALLKKAQIYAHRIDWLVSGDDGEDSFRERLAEDLQELEKERTISSDDDL